MKDLSEVIKEMEDRIQPNERLKEPLIDMQTIEFRQLIDNLKELSSCNTDIFVVTEADWENKKQDVVIVTTSEKTAKRLADNMPNHRYYCRRTVKD